MAVDFGATVLAAAMEAFGEPVLYTPKAGAPFRLASGGIFTASHEAVATAGELEVSSVAPTLGVRLSDFPAPPAQDDTFLLEDRGESHRVADVEPDGHGGAALILHRI